MADVEKALKILADELDKILNDEALLAKYKEGTDREKGYIYLYITVPKSVAKYAWEAIKDPYPYEEDNEYFYTLSVSYDPEPVNTHDTEFSPEMWITLSDGVSPIDLPFEITSTVWSIFERETKE